MFKPVTQPHNIDECATKRDTENYYHIYHDRDNPTRHPAESNVPNNQTLTNILGLLETRISVDDGDRRKSEKDAKMKRDWMLAAAVLDRLCFIALIAIFTGGTLVFVLLVTFK